MQTVAAMATGLKPIRWEAHACLPLVPGQDMSGLSRYRDAGFHHVSINVGMDMTPFTTVLQTLAGFRAWLARHDAHFRLVGEVADLHRAHEQGKLAVSFDLEGSTMLLDDPAMVGLYAALGVRQMLLAYNRDNACAGGCHGEGGGLTTLGRAVVADTSPKQIAGLSGGLFNTFGNLASITTPIVIGYIIAATGSFKWALVYVGANALVAVFSYLFIVGRIQRVELRTADGEILGATQPDPVRA